jgi:hypothetical protein
MKLEIADHCSNTGITGPNAAQGMDVCQRSSVLCCVATGLAMADPPSMELYQTPTGFVVSESILTRSRPEAPNP